MLLLNIGELLSGGVPDQLCTARLEKSGGMSVRRQWRLHTSPSCQSGFQGSIRD